VFNAEISSSQASFFFWNEKVTDSMLMDLKFMKLSANPRLYRQEHILYDSSDPTGRISSLVHSYGFRLLSPGLLFIYITGVRDCTGKRREEPLKLEYLCVMDYFGL